MKYYFFVFLFLYTGIVNGQSKTFSINDVVIKGLCDPYPEPLIRYISEVSRDSSSYYINVITCFAFLQDTSNITDYWEYARLCGGIFVKAKLESQLCPSTYRDKEQLCTSRYQVTGLSYPRFDTIDAFEKIFGRYLEVKEYPVSSDYWRWTAMIFINNKRDVVRVYQRFCRDGNCE